MPEENAPPPTYRGRPISDEEIQRLADEAEAGYDPARLRRVPGRPAMGSAAARVVPVRLDPELDDALRRRAEADHTTASDVVRTALRSWLASA